MANIVKRYRIATISTAPDWDTVFRMVFGNAVHSESMTEGNVGVFGFESEVIPAPFFAGIVEEINLPQ